MSDLKIKTGWISKSFFTELDFDWYFCVREKQQLKDEVKIKIIKGKNKITIEKVK